jgi:hypothetical protein
VASFSDDEISEWFPLEVDSTGNIMDQDQLDALARKVSEAFSKSEQSPST